MIKLRGLRLCPIISYSKLHLAHRRQYGSVSGREPLRILFCGSDDFSSCSLKALHSEHQRHPDRIASIDVICRPGKRTGQGLKKIRQVPTKAVARELKLPIHEVDTFTGWELPVLEKGPVNLLVTVSFGLLVPPRILESIQYGGINLHPSILPDLRGAAPLHHALLAQRKHVGMTIQTLDPKCFDHGKILLQTPPPGLEIPNPESCTFQDLERYVAPKAADMLVQFLRRGLYIPPLNVMEPEHRDQSGELLTAPKLVTEDRHIKWSSWDGAEILRRQRVLGGLWSTLGDVKVPSVSPSLIGKRILLYDLSAFEHSTNIDHPPGRLIVVEGPGKTTNLVVRTLDGVDLRVDRFLVDGKHLHPVEAAQSARDLFKLLPEVKVRLRP
ncbi:MAG: hypothetical protein M1825_000805 [Sarcosagium campestre]|nr:MAG: hypothetical protein M1825_000805 [Sarcosagium campestre]